MSQKGRGQGRASIPNNSKNFQFGHTSKPDQNLQDSSYTKILKTPTSQPLKKSAVDKVIYLSEKDRRLFGQPNTLAKQYLELDQEFPIVNRKTREYYEAILKETNTIKFVHVNLNPGARISEIQFSKAFVNGFLSFSDWGVNLNKARILKFYQMEYTYWDYIEAWSKAFLYQNSYHTHSWWIRLDGFKWPNIEDFKNVPYWFYNWLHSYGPEPEFLPKEFSNIFKEYHSSNPRIKNLNEPILNFYLFHFIGNYDIPWIFQWTYSIASQNKLIFLVRDIYYKWWPKFDTTDLLKKIQNDIKTYKEINDAIKAEEQKQYISKIEQQEFKTPSFASLKKKFPNASPDDLKKKMLEAISCQIDILNDDDIMSTSSKDPNDKPTKPSQDDINIMVSQSNNCNEDMDDYLGDWIHHLESPIKINEDDSLSTSSGDFTLQKTKKDKGKNIVKN